MAPDGIPTPYMTAELAEAAGVSQELIRKWRERGKLPEPRAKVAAGYIWWGDEIEAWISDRKGERA